MQQRIGQFLLPLAVTLAFWPGILGAATSPRWWVIAVGMGLLFPFSQLSRIPNQIWTLLTLSFAGIFLSIHNPVGLGEGIKFLLLVLAFIWGMSLPNLTKVISGFATGLAINSILVIAQTLGWNFLPAWESAGPAGLFYNREVLAELAAPILVWGLARNNWTIVLSSISPLLLCQSRVAVIAAIVGIFAAGNLPLKKYAPVIIVFPLLLITIVIVLFTSFKIASLFDRFSIWQLAISEILPFGRGLGYWELNHPDSKFVHSDLLQLFVEIGPILSLPILAIPVLIIWKSRHDSLEILAVAIVLLVEAILSFPLHQPATAFLSAVLFGHLSRRCQIPSILHHRLVRIGESIRGINPDQDLGFSRRAKSK